MAKRKLFLKELELCVLEADFDRMGRLKPSHKMHVGRMSVRDGRILAIACNLEPSVRWRYHMNPWILLTPTLCRECVLKVLTELAEDERAVVEDAITPLSNRGVKNDVTP